MDELVKRPPGLMKWVATPGASLVFGSSFGALGLLFLVLGIVGGAIPSLVTSVGYLVRWRMAARWQTEDRPPT